MERIISVTWKVVGAGLLGMGIFLALLFLSSALLPKGDHMDVPQGFAAGFLMIADVAVAMFLSGAVAALLTFNDLSSFKQALLIPLSAGLVTSVPALLLAILFAFFALGLFLIAMIAILICLTISVLGGLVVYLMLVLLKALRKKIKAPGPS